MNGVLVPASESGGALASFGSGDKSGGGRALGVQSLFNRSARLAENSNGRGSAARRRLAAEIAAATQRRRGRNNLVLSDAERADFTRRLRALAG